MVEVMDTLTVIGLAGIAAVVLYWKSRVARGLVGKEAGNGQRIRPTKRYLNLPSTFAGASFRKISRADEEDAGAEYTESLMRRGEF